jgi:ligand-binding SRPBCC domain-containing protein
MNVYQRSTRVKAPLSEVWAFHSRVDGLTALTPKFANLRVDAVRGPDGSPDPGILVEGSEIDLSARPFGVGPRQGFTSRIAKRVEGEGSAYFRDDMVDGPLPHWEHTHSFFADGDETVLRDRIEYRLPGGKLGDAVGPLAYLGFEPGFRYRHRETKRLLE